MIRSTLAAVPRRLPVLWSKAAVFGVVALVAATLGAFVAFAFGSRIVSGTPAAMGLTHEEFCGACWAPDSTSAWSA